MGESLTNAIIAIIPHRKQAMLRLMRKYTLGTSLTHAAIAIMFHQRQAKLGSMRKHTALEKDLTNVTSATMPQTQLGISSFI